MNTGVIERENLLDLESSSWAWSEPWDLVVRFDDYDACRRLVSLLQERHDALSEVGRALGATDVGPGRVLGEACANWTRHTRDEMYRMRGTLLPFGAKRRVVSKYCDKVEAVVAQMLKDMDDFTGDTRLSLDISEAFRPRQATSGVYPVFWCANMRLAFNTMEECTFYHFYLQELQRSTGLAADRCLERSRASIAGDSEHLQALALRCFELSRPT
ncbi:MAG: hypothetical protein Q7V53_03415 [Caldisericota bacterium]|nr:hypothetical protein [Caldisericota bacterium]